MDSIHIRDLTLHCLIGTKPDERVNKQDVVLNIVLDVDLAPAGQSDDLGDTVNYRSLKKRIAAMIEDSEFFLIERMARAAADICLEDERVLAAEITVDKPGALTKARSVAVQIRREARR